MNRGGVQAAVAATLTAFRTIKAPRSFWLAGALAILLAGLAPAPADAQSGKPIRIIVPFAPAGSSDVLARVLQPALQQALGQTVIVENRAGAGSNLGTVEAARAMPDGSTFLLTSSAFLVNPALYENVPYDFAKDFVPIAQLPVAPNVFAVSAKNTAINSLADIVTIAKANPQDLNYASPGNGTTPQLTMELFKLKAGINVTNIAYNGGGPATQALMTGTVDVLSTALPGAQEQVRGGTMKGIALTTMQRWPTLPNVLTFVEAGYPDITLTTEHFLLAPAGTSPAIVDRMAKAVLAALARDDVKAKLAQLGYLIVAAGPDDAKKRIAAAIKDGADALSIAEASLEDDETAPVRRRFVVNDSSVEKLGEILNENPNGLVVYRDELIGLLRSLDKEGQEGARAFYLEAWNGNGRFTYDRIARGTIDIEAAILSIIGGIQPGPLAEYQRAALQSGKGDDGLLQRFQLSVWPDVSRAWRNVDRWPDTTAKQRAWSVFQRLYALDWQSVGAACDGDDPDGIPYLRFSADAQRRFDEWRGELESKVRGGDEHPAMESALAKYRSLIPALALLIHLANDQEGPVDATALGQAIGWGDYLESHARRVFASTIDPAADGARVLAGKIQAGKLGDRFALREIYRHGWSGLRCRDEAQPAVDVLVELGWIREAVEPSGPEGGAPKTFIEVNPKIGQLAQRPSAKTDKTLPDGGSVSFVSGQSGSAGEIWPVDQSDRGDV